MSTARQLAPARTGRRWSEAWGRALYGPGGFSVRGDRGPRHDFSTSATRGPRLGGAFAELIVRLRPAGAFDVVDVGAGDGRLLTDIRAALPPEVAGRASFTAVELAPRPPDLSAGIAWRAEPPGRVRGLIVAHEWLDSVPCDVVERAEDGDLHQLLVDADGRPGRGAHASGPERDWLDRWWPIGQPGAQADVGTTRDAAWRALTGRLEWGLAVAVDYGHEASGRPRASTLAGWAQGRRVPPVPDGSCDLTAHVALDSCADPGDLLTTQRAALRALGLTGTLPREAAGPAESLRRLARAAEERALLDPAGLGAYRWLLHGRGVDAATVVHGS